MLKIKLPESEFNALPDAIKAEYKKVGETYTLDTDVPVADVTPIQNALNHERVQNTERQTKIVALETEVTALKTAAGGNYKALETSWETKLATRERELLAKQSTLEKALRKRLVDDEAMRIATALSKHPALLLPHVTPRLTLEEDGEGNYITRVLDVHGKPSALSVKEFQESLLDNAELAPIITASQASGSGASGGQKKKPTGSATKSFKEMNEAERVELFRTNPAEFKRLQQNQ